MKKLYVEIADSPLKREYGLMDRKTLAKNHGMLFKFPQDNHLSFWMSNTYIPLQIAFVNNDGKILQVEDMVPLSTRAIVSRHRCKYALEVNKGWFDKNNIGVGDYIGGHGISSPHMKTAQMTPPIGEMPIEMPPVQDPMGDMGGMSEVPQAAPQVPSASVEMNKTYKEILEDANIRGKELIIRYQKLDGYRLPPKVISPPFTFEADADGVHDAVVKAWDNQDGQWKSFTIGNILELEEKEEKSIEEKEI